MALIAPPKKQSVTASMKNRPFPYYDIQPHLLFITKKLEGVSFAEEDSHRHKILTQFEAIKKGNFTIERACKLLTGVKKMKYEKDEKDIVYNAVSGISEIIFKQTGIEGYLIVRNGIIIIDPDAQ